jgi:hypothetical protein
MPQMLVLHQFNKFLPTDLQEKGSCAPTQGSFCFEEVFVLLNAGDAKSHVAHEPDTIMH